MCVILSDSHLLPFLPSLPPSLPSFLTAFPGKALAQKRATVSNLEREIAKYVCLPSLSPSLPPSLPPSLSCFDFFPSHPSLPPSLPRLQADVTALESKAEGLAAGRKDTAERKADMA